ncbi:MAG TPA: hypothetical protein VFW89_08795 [Gemmatimonadaceae bacterium]|nr:hypothetical protein [Gemmatimonadaceae bacterium]
MTASTALQSLVPPSAEVRAEARARARHLVHRLFPLTPARRVVFNDLHRALANHWQAEHRAYRIGQTGPVNVTCFVAEGTTDEFVMKALAEGRDLPAGYEKVEVAR